MAQLGELARARELSSRAARGFGAHEDWRARAASSPKRRSRWRCATSAARRARSPRRRRRWRRVAIGQRAAREADRGAPVAAARSARRGRRPAVGHSTQRLAAFVAAVAELAAPKSHCEAAYRGARDALVTRPQRGPPPPGAGVARRSRRGARRARSPGGATAMSRAAKVASFDEVEALGSARRARARRLRRGLRAGASGCRWRAGRFCSSWRARCAEAWPPRGSSADRAGLRPAADETHRAPGVGIEAACPCLGGAAGASTCDAARLLVLGRTSAAGARWCRRSMASSASTPRAARRRRRLVHLRARARPRREPAHRAARAGGTGSGGTRAFDRAGARAALARRRWRDSRRSCYSPLRCRTRRFAPPAPASRRRRSKTMTLHCRNLQDLGIAGARRDRRDRSRIRPLPRRRPKVARRQPRRRARVGRRRRRAGGVRPGERQAARTLARACDAGTAFDGKHLWQIAEAHIDKIDPASGDVRHLDPAPGGGGVSGLAWAEGACGSGMPDGEIHHVDAAPARAFAR